MTDSLQFPFAEPPELGTALELAPGVKWLRMPLPMSLNHINLYLLDIGPGWVVIDTGIKGDKVQTLWRKILSEQLEGKPLLGVMVTHMHPDHLGQASWLTDQYRVPLYMTMGEYMSGRTFAAGPTGASNWRTEQFLTGAGFDQAYVGRFLRNRGKGFGNMMEPMPTAYNRLKDGDQLTWGNGPWQVITGEGHSPEHACLFSAARKLLFAGDQIIATITSNVSVMAIEPEANPLRQWLESHHKFMQLPADTLVLPAHGLPFMGLHARLQQLIDHHENHLLALEEACLQPRCSRDLLPVMFKRELREDQLGLALGECIAHLHLLLDRGRMERSKDADGVYYYKTLDESVRQRVGTVQHLKADPPFYV